MPVTRITPTLSPAPRRSHHVVTGWTFPAQVTLLWWGTPKSRGRGGRGSASRAVGPAREDHSGGAERAVAHYSRPPLRVRRWPLRPGFAGLAVARRAQPGRWCRLACRCGLSSGTFLAGRICQVRRKPGTRERGSLPGLLRTAHGARIRAPSPRGVMTLAESRTDSCTETPLASRTEHCRRVMGLSQQNAPYRGLAGTCSRRMGARHRDVARYRNLQRSPVPPQSGTGVTWPSAAVRPSSTAAR